MEQDTLQIKVLDLEETQIIGGQVSFLGSSHPCVREASTSELLKMCAHVKINEFNSAALPY